MNVKSGILALSLKITFRSETLPFAVWPEAMILILLRFANHVSEPPLRIENHVSEV